MCLMTTSTSCIRETPVNTRYTYMTSDVLALYLGNVYVIVAWNAVLNIEADVYNLWSWGIKSLMKIG